MRWLSTLLVAATAVFAVPAVALADTGYNNSEWIIDHDTLVLNDQEAGECQGHRITGTDTWGKIEVTGGTHRVILDNCSYSGSFGQSAIDITGGANVTITVTGTNTLYGGSGVEHPAICIEDGSSLTIIGDGVLTANGSSNGAGIGVDPGATLTIGQHVGPYPTPVTVNANGGSSGGALGAAGIGGDDNDNFGNVIINSGIVNATGGGSAAGIGSGHGGAAWTATGNITINGGLVHAIGGDGAAGVATGSGLGCGENVNYGGTITINGGVVHAIGGDDDQASIGGGGSGIGDRNNGTFVANGNAVIVAPWGIGDTSGQADWKCILLSDETVEYDATTGNVTFTGGAPQVVGNVEADYNITVYSPASLRVTDGSVNNGNPATLTMKSDTTLTNNNQASYPGIAGIALMPGSTLVLEEGTSQCLGDGTMIATSTEGTGLDRGKVQLPLSDDMVTVNPNSYVYDGAAKEPTVTVSFPKWSFSQTFAQGSEYTVSYMDNINVGTATATATSAGGNLLNRNVAASTGSATFEITQGNFVVSTVSRRFIQVGEEHLIDKLPSTPTFGANNPPNVEGGTFEWFSDEGCTVPLTDTFVQKKVDGDQVTVYWKYTQTSNQNVVASKTGTTLLIMTGEKPPAVQIDGETDNIFKSVTYGHSSYTPEIKIRLNDGQTWINPLSEVTYSINNQTPAGKGDVVTVNEKTGEIQFVGAGDATVMAEIHAYTDPNATDQDKGNTYGPAYVTITIQVAPKRVSVDEASVKVTDRVYNGTSKVEVTAGLVESETVGDDFADGLIGVSAKGTAAQPEVGSNIVVDVEYTLTGDKADDYTLANDPSTTVNISKARAGDDTLQGKTGEITISNCAAATYVYDLNKLVPDSKSVGNGDGTLYPGWIEFARPQVKISDNRYFTADDIRIDNVTHTLYLTVNDVESHDTTRLGTITLDMISPNFEGMVGTINVMREDMKIHTITATAGEGGSITPSGAVEVVDGHDQTFTVSANQGYAVESVTIDNGQVVTLNADGTYTFSNVTGNHTISATFKSTSGGTTPGGGGTTKYYEIEASAGEGGSISPEGIVRVPEGGDRTFTITPDEGYTIGNVVIDGKDYRQVASYTFNDVDEDHTISVTFMKGNDPANPDDTGVSDWLQTDDHVVFLHGYGDGSFTFGPENPMTRAEVAQMFYNLLLDKSMGEKPVAFTDVPDDAYYAEPVRVLASHGIINGTSPETFEPNRAITRAEFVAIAMRFSNGEFEGKNLFVDVPEDAWYRDYVVGAVGYGWIYGYQDGSQKFGPNDTITRGQATMVTNRMLWRSCDTVWAVEHMDELKTFVDLSQSHYAFFDVVEATNAHDYERVGNTRYENWTGLVK